MISLDMAKENSEDEASCEEDVGDGRPHLVTSPDLLQLYLQLKNLAVMRIILMKKLLST